MLGGFEASFLAEKKDEFFFHFGELGNLFLSLTDVFNDLFISFPTCGGSLRYIPRSPDHHLLLAVLPLSLCAQDEGRVSPGGDAVRGPWSRESRAEQVQDGARARHKPQVP